MPPLFALMTHANCGAGNGPRQKSQCLLLEALGHPHVVRAAQLNRDTSNF